MNERRTCISPTVMRFLGKDAICPDSHYMRFRSKLNCGLCPKQGYFEREEVIQASRAKELSRRDLSFALSGSSSVG